MHYSNFKPIKDESAVISEALEKPLSHIIISLVNGEKIVVVAKYCISNIGLHLFEENNRVLFIPIRSILYTNILEEA